LWDKGRIVRLKSALAYFVYVKLFKQGLKNFHSVFLMIFLNRLIKN